MESPLWHAIGTFSVVAFALAILLSFLARYWFRSQNSTAVKLGAKIIIALGGAGNAHAVQAEMMRRRVTG